MKSPGNHPLESPVAFTKSERCSALTTADFASALALKPGTLRRRLCSHGSYYGVIPLKLANGKLIWPEDGINALIRG